MMTIKDVLDSKKPKPLKKYWMGTVREKDDFEQPITDTFFDGKTVMGPWATMSPTSWRKYGCGTGLGHGQKYQKQEDGRWLKVAG